MTMCVLYVYAAASIGAVLGFMLCAVLWEDDDGRSNLRGNRSL
jgi:hypothetical protein